MKPEFVRCTHLEGTYITVDPDGYHFDFGDGRVLSVCELCASKMQVELVTAFLRQCDSTPRPFPSIFRRGR